MSLELSEITLIRLQTELENAIGFREHYLKRNDIVQVIIWDNEIVDIIDQIVEMGA